MPGGAPPIRVRRNESTLIVIDVQEKLLPAIPAAPSLVTNISFLLDVASLLTVPVIATEQYPKGLGRTVEPLRSRLTAAPAEKVAFSCCGDLPETISQVMAGGRTTAVVCGMESHVCVLQTVLDLLDAGVRVAVAADAVAARGTIDHDIAIRRMARSGAVIATAETIAFEWAGTAGIPEFKAFSRLVQDRAASIALQGRSETGRAT